MVQLTKGGYHGSIFAAPLPDLKSTGMVDPARRHTEHRKKQTIDSGSSGTNYDFISSHFMKYLIV
jgi:hypothetical protein